MQMQTHRQRKTQTERQGLVTGRNRILNTPYSIRCSRMIKMLFNRWGILSSVLSHLRHRLLLRLASRWSSCLHRKAGASRRHFGYISRIEQAIVQWLTCWAVNKKVGGSNLGEGRIFSCSTWSCALWSQLDSNEYADRTLSVGRCVCVCVCVCIRLI